MKQIDISKVLQLAKGHKYEIVCASFDVVDHIFKIDIPRSMRGRKLAVQAITLLADGLINYAYDEKPESEENTEAAPAEEAEAEATPTPSSAE